MLRRSEVDGSWDALCRKARAHDGTTVISHELFAAASAHQVTAALTELYNRQGELQTQGILSQTAAVAFPLVAGKMAPPEVSALKAMT